MVNGLTATGLELDVLQHVQVGVHHGLQEHEVRTGDIKGCSTSLVTSAEYLPGLVGRHTKYYARAGSILNLF